MRVYTVEAENIAVTVAADVAELTPADDKPLAVLAFQITQNTELGDAAEEQIRLRWIRGHTTSGSGGTATTPRPVDPDDAAAGFTCETFNTTAASVGTTVNLQSWTFNVRVGDLFVIPTALQPKVTQANTTLVCRMMAAPTDSVSFSLTIWVGEGI